MRANYHRPKWNSVSEGMPTKANKFYLVTIDGETPYTDISLFDGTNWEDKGITHWMSMPTPGKKRWNDVNIIPPHESGTYLVVLDGELVGQEKPFTSICGFYDGKWDDWGVIRWMPLPEPAQQPLRPKKPQPISKSQPTDKGCVALQKKYNELKILWDMYGGDLGITTAFQKAATLDKVLEHYRGHCSHCIYAEHLSKAKSTKFKENCQKCTHFGQPDEKLEDRWEWDEKLSV